MNTTSTKQWRLTLEELQMLLKTCQYMLDFIAMLWRSDSSLSRQALHTMCFLHFQVPEASQITSVPNLEGQRCALDRVEVGLPQILLVVYILPEKAALVRQGGVGG